MLRQFKHANVSGAGIGWAEFAICALKCVSSTDSNLSELGVKEI